MKPSLPKIQQLDVRPQIAAGGSPFEQIITATSALAVGEALLVITPFLPSPLIEKLQSEGFSARPQRRGDAAWETLFKRVQGREPVPAE
ncbi:MAG: DUF2249 domain-containing protein [Opitutus sp.]